MPFYLPWIRVALLIQQIRATTWDDTTWTPVKEALRRALALQIPMRRQAWWN
jgi:hypothetical protein